jgi:tetratricopeptide (TPR) repeat protein
MKLFLKILKIIISSVLFIYILTVVFILFIWSKEQRFSLAEHSQGSLFSQTMLDILKFQYPDYSDVYFEQSVAFNKYGYHDKGFELLDQAVDLDPIMHLGYRGYMKLRFLRDYHGALADLNRLDTLTPNFNDAPWGENIDFLRGECYYGNKDYQKAIEYFERNINNQLEGWADIQSFVYLGICEYRLKNYNQAIIQLNSALQHSDKTTEAYFYLAKVYKAMDSLPKSKEYLIKSKENLAYKHDDAYNEYLNEIYLSDIIELEKQYAQ